MYKVLKQCNSHGAKHGKLLANCQVSEQAKSFVPMATMRIISATCAGLNISQC